MCETFGFFSATAGELCMFPVNRIPSCNDQSRHTIPLEFHGIQLWNAAKAVALAAAVNDGRTDDRETRQDKTRQDKKQPRSPGVKLFQGVKRSHSRLCHNVLLVLGLHPVLKGS
jgi:hypothetical protein